MIRSFCTTLFRFVAAAVLLALVLCACEVGLRFQRLRNNLAGPATEPVANFTLPSSASWIDVRPLLNTHLADETGNMIHVRTSELGLRGPTVSVPKPPGSYRILCLGGSAVFGPGVDQSAAVTARMRTYLEPYAPFPLEVINAGCPEAGPLVSLLRYRHELASLQADLVILCLSPEELRQDELIKGMVRLDGTRNPAYAPHPAADGREWNSLDSLCEEFVTVKWVMTRLGRAAETPAIPSRQPLPAVPDARRWASAVPLHSLVSAHRGRLAIAVAPGIWSVQPAPLAEGQTPPPTEADHLKSFLAEVGLAPVVAVDDSLTLFRQAPDLQSFFLPVSGELSAEGHDRLARILASFVLRIVPELRSSTAVPPPVEVPRPRPSDNLVPPPIASPPHNLESLTR